MAWAASPAKATVPSGVWASQRSAVDSSSGQACAAPLTLNSPSTDWLRLCTSANQSPEAMRASVRSMGADHTKAMVRPSGPPIGNKAMISLLANHWCATPPCGRSHNSRAAKALWA